MKAYQKKEVLKEASKYWKNVKWKFLTSKNNKNHVETNLLKLNCDKALHTLQWKATLNFKETAKWTGEWYRTFYKNETK